MVAFTCLDVLEVVARIVVSAELAPESLEDVLNTDEATFRDVLVSAGEHLKPGQNGPQAVFLSDVRRTSSKGFLSTKSNQSLVHKISEEFPSSWGFIELNAELLGYLIDSTRSRHTAGDAIESLLKEEMTETSQYS